jgi:hypothetical protein
MVASKVRNMLKGICRNLALIGCLVAAQSASAIPMKFEITSSANAAAAGAWTLSGPTADGGLWAVGPGGYFTDGADIGPGEYTWSIQGLGGAWGYGQISWSLFLGTALLDTGSDSGDWIIKVFDTSNFEVGRANRVPEPGTLSLLGLGLVAVGFSVRRRRAAQ